MSATPIPARAALSRRTEALSSVLGCFMALLFLGLPAQAQTHYASWAGAPAATDVPSGRLSVLDHNMGKLSREIAVDLTDVTLQEALERIAAEGGLRFAFGRARVSGGERVTLRAEKITVLRALQEATRGTAFQLQLTRSGQLILAEAPRTSELPRPMELRAGTIAGRVTDALTGEPIPGVNVVVEGTTQGASTDVDGLYRIVGVEAGTYTLVASFVGYADEAEEGVVVEDDATTTVDFALQEGALDLDEVVVVGYGTQERRDVTGAVASISPQRLEEAANTSVTQALQGAVPGLTIRRTSAGAEQDDFDILLRGRNSIKAGNNPLVVVDGIPYSGNLAELNQADIAAIDVLKDASSAAIYGSRGANGVILITTKQGTSGQARVSYEGYAGALDVANVPDIMTGPEFAAFKCDRLGDGNLEGDCGGVLTPTEVAGIEAGGTDWIDLATRTGFQQQHTLALRGGTGTTKYYVSGALLDVNGVALNDAFNRYTLRVNLDQEVASWLDIGTNTQLSYADRSGQPASFGDAFYMNPLARPYEDDGTTQTIFPWAEDPFFSNPLQGLNVVDDHTVRRVLTNNFVAVDVPFLDGLSYRLNTGVDFRDRDLGRYFGRNTAVGLSNGGRAITESESDFDWTVDNILTYERAFGPHELGLTALYGAQGSENEEEELEAEGFPNDILTYYQADVAAVLDPSRDFSDWRLVSQMGRANYNYDGRYLLTLTVRRDGFSGFGAENKYGVFPSLALGWNLSEEPFLQRAGFLDQLKLRLSYGRSGNQAIGPYQTLPRLRERSYVDGSATAPGYLPDRLGNAGLRWETTQQLNVGADFGLLDGRLSGSLDAYWATTEDLLLDRSISPVHGVTSIAENLGEVKNRGVELALAATVLDRGDLRWRADLNVSANRNEIVDLYGDGADDVGNEWFIGEPIRVDYDHVFDGIWQEGDDIAGSAQPDAQPGDVRVRDLNGDGLIDDQDRTILGRADPRFTFGLNTAVSFRNLTLSASLYGVEGVTRRNPLLDEPDQVVWGDVRRNTLARTYWTPENPINTFPANREGVNPWNVRFYQEASFLRLRDVTVAYRLPGRLLGDLGLQHLRLYVTGRNLLTITGWNGLDPELGGQRSIPIERSYIGGVSFTF